MNLPTTAAQVSQTFYTYDEQDDARLSRLLIEPNGSSHRTLERTILESAAPRFGGLYPGCDEPPLGWGFRWHDVEILGARGYLKLHHDSPKGAYWLVTPLGMERWIEIMRQVMMADALEAACRGPV